MLYRFFFRVGRVLLKRIVNDGIITLGIVFFMEQDGFYIRFHDDIDVFLFEHRISVEYDFVPLDGNHLSGILVHKILMPGIEYPGGQFTAQDFFQPGFGHLYLFRKIEDFEDVLVALVSDGPEQSSHRQLFLTVDIGVHHAVDVCSKFDPGAFKRYHPGGVQFGTIGMERLSKEHPGRTVKLRNHHAFCPVDHKGTARGHVGDGPQVHILYNGFKIFVFGIGTIQLEPGFQGNAVGKTALNTFLNGISGRIYEVIQEFQNKLVPGIGNWKVFHEGVVQTFIAPLVRLSFKLKEILK